MIAAVLGAGALPLGGALKGGHGHRLEWRILSLAACPMALIHLIYVSTAHQEMSPADLGEILDACMRNNSPRRVTGMLLYAGGSFMQVLEGEEADVDAVFGHIRRDPRHGDLIVLERTAIPERSFERWHMGFRRLGQADARAHPGFAPFFQDGFKAASIGAKPGLALEILNNFRDTLAAC